MRRLRTLAGFVALACWTGPASVAVARSQCAALASLALADTKITSAEPVGAAAADHLPAFCRVLAEANARVGTGGIAFGIRFELRLPERWNRRFFFQGGGGTDGVIFPPVGLAQGLLGASGNDGSALSRGFATVSTDSGHQGFGQEFGLDAQARIDFGYNALDVVTRRSKEIIRRYYRRPVKRSYLIGCSNGGRQAMVASQRFPEHFDGIVAASPAFDLPAVSIGEAWDTQALTAIAPTDGSGRPVLGGALSDADLALVAAAVLDACDGLDGLTDGLVDAPSACRFDPAVLVCPAGQVASCLSRAQVDALRRIFDGAHDSRGTPLYATWPWDPGIGAIGWRSWKLGDSPTAIPNALNTQIGFSAMRYVLLTPPDPAFDPLAFDFDADPPRTMVSAATFEATSTDLTAFRRRRGKLLMYAGVADPVFSAHDLVAYYGRLVAAQGGLRATQRFVLLFLVPGMNHCSGGPTLDRFDPLTAMVRWVEKGRPPSRLVATGAAFPGRSRPLCPYPRETRYRGRGSTQKAGSFRCVRPAT